MGKRILQVIILLMFALVLPFGMGQAMGRIGVRICDWIDARTEKASDVAYKIG